jgi:uncharacterized integral membrane protein
MNEDKWLLFICGICLGLILAVFILGNTNNLPHHVVKRQQVEAVSVGAAEWVVNPEGKVTFQWKEQK